jgi:hypothetical protein
MPMFAAFMVFPPEVPEPDPEPAARGIDRYLAWQEELRATGGLVTAAGLAPDSRVVHAGAVTNGPFTESSEMIAGYLVVEADDLDEAAKLFLRHPIAEDGIGRFVLHEIALTDRDSRDEHLRRFDP